MAGVAQEPGHVNEAATTSAPRLLARALGARPALAPARTTPAIVEMHRRWADAHTPADAASGIVGRARAGAEQLSMSLAPALGEDRALIGHVIRATDLLASRCDELAARIEALESALDDVVAALGADLVQIRASLARAEGATRLRRRDTPKKATNDA